MELSESSDTFKTFIQTASHLKELIIVRLAVKNSLNRAIIAELHYEHFEDSKMYLSYIYTHTVIRTNVHITQIYTYKKPYQISIPFMFAIYKYIHIESIGLVSQLAKILPHVSA